MPSFYADEIMSKYRFVTMDDTKEIYQYEKGIYVPKGKITIEKECEKIIPQCGTHVVNEVIDKIKRRTFKSRSEFNKDFSKLVLENGVLDLDTLKLSDFDPTFLTTIKLPVTYNPHALCPKFVKFLKDCLEPRGIVTVVEEIANVLNANTKNFEISALWIGDGANGKSTLMKIIEGIFGSENCSSVSIHDMQYRRFAIAEMYGKLINKHADISSKELNNLGIFKQLVSGDTIQAERKNQNPFNFRCFAKHFFSANEMPVIKDDSDGTYRRIEVTNFPNQFISGVNCIKDLDKIILEEEKSGIFNLLLQNYKTLRHNNGFRYKQPIGEVRAQIKRESDRLREFIDTCIIKISNSYIPKSELYPFYQKWCENNGYEILSKPQLGARLPTYGIGENSMKMNGKTVRVWTDIQLNGNNGWVKKYIQDNYGI